MRSSSTLPVLALVVAFVAACSGGSASGGDSPVSPPPTEMAATATAAPTSTPQPTVRRDIRASRLVIPSLQINTEVKTSQVVPNTSAPPPGCPARPEDKDTLTVPEQGIATPADGLEGLENKAWIFGHSRWQNRPGVFFSLQEISVGDELFVDGADRATGEPVSSLRFVVTGIYLTDTDSGEKLISAETPGEIPSRPVVILQTSVREQGSGKQWILNEQKLRGKSTNLVEGDINDPCKYLLLFVIAQPS